MRHSTSTNSLTELNPQIVVDPTTEVCFLCLEDILEKNDLFTHSRTSCKCRYSAHIACWQKWRTNRDGFECPICRKRVDPPRIAIPLETLEPDLHSSDAITTKFMILCFILIVVVIIIIILSVT
jgi:hypothetical protein